MNAVSIILAETSLILITLINVSKKKNRSNDQNCLKTIKRSLKKNFKSGIILSIYIIPVSFETEKNPDVLKGSKFSKAIEAKYRYKNNF